VKCSSKAWQNASLNSPIGMIAQTFTAALGSYLLAVSTDPAAPLPADLVSILATVANKELTQEDLDAIEARIAQENPDNLLFQSLADPSLETTNLQLQTTLQSFDSTLITMSSDLPANPDSGTIEAVSKHQPIELRSIAGLQLGNRKDRRQGIPG
jgi:hypothetical protein